MAAALAPFLTAISNNGNTKFRSVSATSGEALRQARSSRGAAFDDLDADGRIDAVILNCDSEAQVLRNSSLNDNSWLILDLVSTSANRDAIGAKVWVHSNGKKLYLERINGRGYQSHYAKRLHYGLGQLTKIDRIEVLWPGKQHRRTVIDNVSVNQFKTIVEGL